MYLSLPTQASGKFYFFCLCLAHVLIIFFFFQIFSILCHIYELNILSHLSLLILFLFYIGHLLISMYVL